MTSNYFNATIHKSSVTKLLGINFSRYLIISMFLAVLVSFYGFSSSVPLLPKKSTSDSKNIAKPIPNAMAGGAYMLDFGAADPSIYIPPIPFPPMTAPVGSGNGNIAIPGARFNDGLSDVQVESLAPQDMALGQIVPFETKITVSGDVTPENGTITILIGWRTETTNGGDFGYDGGPGDIGYGVYAAFIDTEDGAHVDPGNDATVTSFGWALEGDEIVGVFTISGLDDNDCVVLESWLVLDDTIPAGIGGNVQSRLIDAETGSDQSYSPSGMSFELDNGLDEISTGNQTVPLLKPSDFFTADVDLSVTKSDDVDPVVQGGMITYTINASNAGPSVANMVTIYDELDPNVTFVSASGGGFINTDSGDTIPDGAVQWDVGALAPGDNVMYTVTVMVNNDAPLVILQLMKKLVAAVTFQIMLRLRLFRMIRIPLMIQTVNPLTWKWLAILRLM